MQMKYIPRMLIYIIYKVLTIGLILPPDICGPKPPRGESRKRGPRAETEGEASAQSMRVKQAHALANHPAQKYFRNPIDFS
jgi:hypothetical protein